MWLELGRGLRGDRDRAFETIVARDRRSAQALALVAEARLDGGEPEAALGLYRKAIERAPAMRGLHAAVARLYRETGHPTGRRSRTSASAGSRPPDCARTPLECRFAEAKHREVLRAGAGSARRPQRYWVARSANVLAGEAFARLEALPPSAPLHEWRAARLRDEERYAESAAEWRKALALAPGDPRRRLELAVTLRLDAGPGGRRARARRARRDAPDSAAVNYLLGDVLLARQQPEPSLPLLQKAVRLDPGLAHAHGALGRAYALVGREAEAIPELEKALARRRGRQPALPARPRVPGRGSQRRRRAHARRLEVAPRERGSAGRRGLEADDHAALTAGASRGGPRRSASGATRRGAPR